MWHLVAFSVNYSQEILGSHYCLYILSTWETSMYILTMKEEQLWYPKMVALHFGNSILKTVYTAIMTHYHSTLSWQFVPAATLPWDAQGTAPDTCKWNLLSPDGYHPRHCENSHKQAESSHVSRTEHSHHQKRPGTYITQHILSLALLAACLHIYSNSCMDNRELYCIVTTWKFSTQTTIVS